MAYIDIAATNHYLVAMVTLTLVTILAIFMLARLLSKSSSIGLEIRLSDTLIKNNKFVSIHHMSMHNMCPTGIRDL